MNSARAEIFFWQDAETDMSVTVPDTWSMVHNQKPDDVLTFVAPSDADFPMCRMRVRQDRRFLIYPQRYSRAIQRINYSDEFWADYVAEFRASELHLAADNAGLGRGYGSFAEFSFIPAAWPKMERKGVAFAALYRDKAYIMECSARASAYTAWLPRFLSVAKSVEFRNEIAQLPGGQYKKLHGAQAISIRNRREIDRYYGHGQLPASDDSVWENIVDHEWGIIPGAAQAVLSLVTFGRL